MRLEIFFFIRRVVEKWLGGRNLCPVLITNTNIALFRSHALFSNADHCVLTLTPEEADAAQTGGVTQLDSN